MAESLNYKLTLDSSPAIQQLKDFGDAAKQVANEVKGAMAEIGRKEVEAKIKVRTAGAEEARKKFKNIEGTIKALSKDQKFYNNLLKQTPAQVKAINKALKEKQSRTRMLAKDGRTITDEWRRITDQIKLTQEALQKMGQASGSAFSRSNISSFLGRLSLVQVAANLATQAILRIVNGFSDLIGQGAQLQILKLTLEAFAGSAAAAGVALSNFRDIASTTSFNLQQVASAGQILLGYGVSIDQATESTRQLSIIASATGGDISNLARNLGQVQTQGRAYTRDLTQFAIQGIPIWTELADVIGISTTEVKQFAADGLIGFTEVQAALDGMTSEGSAFAEIAKRIDQTWIGQLRKLESALQNLALQAVEAFSLIDQAMGGPAATTLSLLTKGFNALAENAGTVAAALASLAIAATGFFTVMAVAKISAIIYTLGGLQSVIAMIGVSLKALTIAMMSNPVILAAIATAAVIAGAAYYTLSTNINRAKTESQALSLGLVGVNDALANLDQASKPFWGFFNISALQAQQHAQELKNKLQGLVEEASKVNEEYVKQRGVLANMINTVERRYDLEIEKQKRIIEGIDEKIQAEEKATNKKIADVNKAYNEEVKTINNIYNEKLRLIDAEIGLLQKRTPEEQKLYNFEKRSLINKIDSGKLSKEELIRAQARLSRMRRQEEIEKLMEKRAKAKAEQEEKIRNAQEKQITAIQNLTTELGKFVDEQEASRRKAELSIRQSEEEKKAAVGKYREILEQQDISNAKHIETKNLLSEQATLVSGLSRKYSDLTDRINDAANAAARLNSKNTNSSIPSNFAGGPISGGSKTHINEFGQEAFLSNSGKLSMINAKPWDVWTAPSSGTIIPAHVAAGLDIPSSGLNVKGRTPTGADSSGNTRLLKGMLNALKQGGSNTTNNVTIQATNTSKAASDVLVTLARIKRRRYN